MRSVVLDARAKINLYLDVLGRLPNGYHAVETLYQSVDLSDRLTVARTSSGITVESDHPDVPTDERNLVVRAARLFFTFTGRDGGVRVRVEKRIPIAGGLGGGSADAAATLIALNELFETHYPVETLVALGSRLGADVAFCIVGGTAWGHGIGDQLTPIRRPDDPFALLVNPGYGIDTKSAFEALGMASIKASPSTIRAERERRQRQFRLTALSGRDTISPAWEPASRPLYNRFEAVILPRYPAIAKARDVLVESGARAAMSGSGATVFGLFDEESRCHAVAESLAARFPFVVETRFADAGVTRVA
jgi:4-diphosphocytidyl-2-C-methyl-D-erythritol kinase